MPDRNAFGLIEPFEAAAASEVEAPAQLANILLLSSRNQDEVSAAPFSGERGRRTWLVAGAFVAVFALGWVGGSTSYRFLNIETAFHPIRQKVKTARRIADSDLKSAANIDDLIRNATSEMALTAPNKLKFPTPAATMAGRGQKPSGGDLPASSSTALEQANATPSRALATREPMIPALETRPTTIEGWTVRDVRGGTAVLEGPDGVWTATRGDTVPGVGRIDSIVRWGNRWIVATANGLIATP